MQLYVLDRAKNTLATTSSFYNDKHHKELTAGASIFEFTIDKSDSAAQYMTTGNYLVFLDDRGRAWSFTILSYDETQTTKTVAAEDVSIELLNKAMDIWNTDQAYPFSYYFNLVTKDTPWKLGVNQLTDLSRKLVYTGRDTGLGRLLSVLKGFDNAECQFNIKVQQNKPVEFTVDVYKSIGTVQDNIQIVYNNELNDIKKTESRAQFVTALAGIGGLVENQATTDPGLEKHIDFTDIDYKDDNFVSPKGDKFLRAVTANRMFNPGTTTYIEDFYDYDTQSAQELLNRTLTQLKERSEPQYTYNADVKVIDPTLDIGDTVTIIDHDYNPALYLQARVATLDKSYTDPTQGVITFCNYRVLNSNLSDQLRAMQNIIDQLPTSASIKVINNNIVQMIADNTELKKQVALSFESANGKSRIWFSKSATAQDGDVAFIKNADGATEIWKFVEGAWKLDTGLATFEDVKKAASAAADAGSQAVIAGQQASAAGAFAASAASQATIETAAAQSAANSAVNQANQAVSQAGFANDTAYQAKSAAASAQADAANALGQASTAIANASTAINAATDAQTKTNSLVTKVDDIAGTIKTLATTETVNQLAGTVATTQSLAQFAADGLKLKADTTTVNQINGTVNDLKGELDLTADGFKTQISSVQTTIDNLQAGENLFVKSTAVPGYVNGAVIAPPVAGENELASDFIAIDPTQPYIFQTWVTVPANNILWTSIGFYDASKVPISRPVWDNVTQTTTTAIHYVNRLNQDGGTVIPSNTAFIRISYRQYDDGRVSFTQGTILRDYALAPEDQATVADVSSQITQLKDDINLRVKTGDLVSQIDVNAKRILLDGASTYITNTTHIDTGVIKTAMIADAAINNAKIANAAIDNAKIANASITAAKIADLAVGSAQIADGAISSAKIGNATITSAKIADASILDAKIVSLDGSKIVAHSITTDKLDVNAIAVGLNAYGAGWQITPMSIAFSPNTAIAKHSLIIEGTGITFGDIGNGETLAMLQGTPYSTTKDAWYNGMLLDLSPNNDYVAMVDESGSAAQTKVAWSRSDKTDFGIYSGFNFYDHAHFNTIGPFDPDSKARLKVIRAKVAGFWCTGFMNSNGDSNHTSGILFSDVGHCYLGRAGKWYDLYDIVKKIGIA